MEFKVMGISQSTIDSLLQKRPDSLTELTAQITPDIYQALRTAIELRKWDDGKLVSNEQLEHCLQLVILYEARFLPESERTGSSIPSSCKNTLEAGAVTPLTIKDSN